MAILPECPHSTLNILNLSYRVWFNRKIEPPCSFPGSPAHSTVVFSNVNLTQGTVATYSCERGFELLGPARRVCDKGSWIPEGIPFCGVKVVIIVEHSCDNNQKRHQQQKIQTLILMDRPHTCNPIAFNMFTAIYNEISNSLEREH
uniref:Sushi domain-containing protein n=1 Tax=Glossina brevipalpis TaxID=37001 RepID=A0A1A9WC40_9MUSC